MRRDGESDRAIASTRRQPEQVLVQHLTTTVSNAATTKPVITPTAAASSTCW
jgi:hypothetical protein